MYSWAFASSPMRFSVQTPFYGCGRVAQLFSTQQHFSFRSPCCQDIAETGNDWHSLSHIPSQLRVPSDSFFKTSAGGIPGKVSLRSTKRQIQGEPFFPALFFLSLNVFLWGGKGWSNGSHFAAMRLTQWDGTGSYWINLGNFHYQAFTTLVLPYMFCYLQAKCSLLMLKAAEAMWPACSQLGVSWPWRLHGNTLASTVSISNIALYPKVTLLGVLSISAWEISPGVAHSSTQEVHLSWPLIDVPHWPLTPISLTISQCQRVPGPSLCGLEETCLGGGGHCYQKKIENIPFGASNHGLWRLREPNTDHMSHPPASRGMLYSLQGSIHDCFLYPDPMSGQPAHSAKYQVPPLCTS